MSDELSLRDLRLQKLARMRELGFDPFAVERFESTGSANDLLADFDANQGQAVAFAGRVVSHRLMGKAGFAHLSDGEGKIQGYFKKDDLGDAAWEVYQLLDIGDHIGVQGELFRTKTGEPSIHVRTLVPLSKALHTIPLGKEKEGQQWYGLTDTEQRYRHRNLDLICNPEAREMLIRRAQITREVRNYLDARGYLEVETPILQIVAGGAAARPFTTHYNAYDMDVKLRISLELYLKRLICGDIPKVYEIGRVFRNEGVSNRHNPEFTLLEFYEAYTDLEGMMEVVEGM
ncbi:MAG: lysine--tRNA ligase, partial [Nitrospirae bacterium]|nr:lysine--tRNA ligase [Fimbriimonadaceae bacterium]